MCTFKKPFVAGLKKFKVIFSFVDTIKADNVMINQLNSEVLRSEILSSGHLWMENGRTTNPCCSLRFTG